MRIAFVFKLAVSRGHAKLLAALLKLCMLCGPVYAANDHTETAPDPHAAKDC
ncbi:hypothetical protein GGD40_000898 [Paraburkholderia bryophila]|uniref:Uncharacterized protein n=1 Tax=Paraburkholderia bryophila TaxID=420952 RepID=A0A7Y9WIF9_9BURK|nr:hypothetical protein [Paraburkholderia bryophila]